MSEKQQLILCPLCEGHETYRYCNIGDIVKDCETCDGKGRVIVIKTTTVEYEKIKTLEPLQKWAEGI